MLDGPAGAWVLLVRTAAAAISLRAPHGPVLPAWILAPFPSHRHVPPRWQPRDAAARRAGRLGAGAHDQLALLMMLIDDAVDRNVPESPRLAARKYMVKGLK